MCVTKDSSTNNQEASYTIWSPPLFDISSPTNIIIRNDLEFARADHVGSVSLPKEEEEEEGEGDCSNTSKDQPDLAMEDIHHTTTDEDEEEDEEGNSSNNSSSNNRKNHKNKPLKSSPTLRRRERGGGGRHHNNNHNSNKSGGGSTGAVTMEQRTVVEHKYHDHYHDALSVVCAGNTISNNSSNSDNGNTHCLLPKRPPGSARGGVTMAFPERLHEMLTTVEEEGLSHVISWQPHGRCFLIHKKSIFVEQVMPRFFHQSKLTSFQRQLNLYGFVRLTAGRDRGGYYHECFLRGRADLCRCMVRTRVKGNGMKAASSPDTEPNFYAMEPCEDHEPHCCKETTSTTTATSGIMIENDSINNTESSTSSRRTSSSSSSSSRIRPSARSSASASTMFPSLEQAVAVELDEIYRGEEAAVMLKARPEEEDMMDIMETYESASPGGGCCSSPSIMMPHVSFSSDFPMMDLVSSMSFPSSSLAAMVSPPDSPNLNPKKQLTKSSIHDIVESALSVADDFDMPLPLHLPHSGDAVFFEGLKFRYLDHLDLVNNHVSDDNNNNNNNNNTQGEDAPGAIASV